MQLFETIAVGSTISRHAQNVTYSSPAAPSSEPDLPLELARQRAAAADAWRGYVETGLVQHRQRALQLEQRNRELEDALSQARQELAQPKPEPPAPEDDPRVSVRRILRRRLRHSAAGRIAYTLREYARLLRPPRGPAEPQILLPVTPKIESASSRGIVLLITHHADDSSDTRLVLDLLHSVQQHYDVMVWHMGEGPMLGEFQAAAFRFMQHGGSCYDYALARTHVAELADEVGAIEFAIVVGKETRSVLPALSAAYIPSVVLLSEPDAYATSGYVFQEIFFWANHTFFTTPSSFAQAERNYGVIKPGVASVLIPGPGPSSKPCLADTPLRHDAAMRYRMGLNDAAPADAVILGWGALNYRSGADLFISCADKLVRSAPDKNYRFVWLAVSDGSAGDPGYGALVQQQIKALGLSDHVAVVYEPVSTTVPASFADLVLLTARDELPQHTAQSAACRGIPVIAFEGTTTLAGMLANAGLANTCLARPGDASELADRAAGWLQNPELRKTLEPQLEAVAQQALKFDRYTEAILNKGRSLQPLIRQQKIDENTIAGSHTLRPDYMGDLGLQAEMFGCSAERLYILSWRNGVHPRKPRPGLLLGLYAQRAMLEDSLEDPYAHYLRNDSPAGPWDFPVVAPGRSAKAPPGSAALHVHAYYPDMLVGIVERLGENKLRPDLFISVKDEASRAEAAQFVKAYRGNVKAIEVVPNRGRDIGPFLTGFGERLVAGYEFIGHVHTKRSEHSDRDTVARWVNFLMENNLGGPIGGAMMDSILGQMAANPSWGIVFPDDPAPIGWDTNRHTAQALANRMGAGELPDHFCFPAGNMFWIRAAALQPFIELGLSYDDYPIEPLPIDGSVLHSIERLFGVIPRSLGMQTALSTIPGLSR